MEYSNEYFLECIQNLRKLIHSMGGCRTIESLMVEQNSNSDIATMNKNQGRDK